MKIFVEKWVENGWKGLVEKMCVKFEGEFGGKISLKEGWKYLISGS